MPAPLAAAPLERMAVMQRTTVARAAFAAEPIARPFALAAAPPRLPGSVARLRPAALIPDADVAASAPLSLLPPTQ